MKCTYRNCQNPAAFTAAPLDGTTPRHICQRHAALLRTYFKWRKTKALWRQLPLSNPSPQPPR